MSCGRQRAQITKRLIQEKGFIAVAVEADWPDAYRVNKYVRSQSGDADTVEALAGFKRCPAWMWRNADVLDFIAGGSGSTTTHFHPLLQESASMDSISTACTLLSRQF